MKHFLCFLFVGFICAEVNASASVAARPFIMPIAAKVAETSKDGKGWQEQGAITVPFVQAEASFRSSMNQSGWAFLHKVPLGGRNARALYTWRKGVNELTLMLWRINVNKTGFSWGIANNKERKVNTTGLGG